MSRVYTLEGQRPRRIVTRPLALGGLSLGLSSADRSNARKRGQTQPKSECPAKRVCTHGTLASAAIAAKRVLLDSACDAHDPLPENLLDWRALRPTKRLKAKSSLDYLAAKSELAAESG